MRTRTEALKAAIATVGSMSALADHLGITPQAVAKWTCVPASRCLDVERITGISRHDLRPDIFGPPRPLGRRRARAELRAA